MNVELYLENGFYGIKEKGVLVVPLSYKEPIGAIEEWEYFEKLNIEKQFLTHKRTIDEISEIKNILLKNLR